MIANNHTVSNIKKPWYHSIAPDRPSFKKLVDLADLLIFDNCPTRNLAYNVIVDFIKNSSTTTKEISNEVTAEILSVSLSTINKILDISYLSASYSVWDYLEDEDLSQISFRSNEVEELDFGQDHLISEQSFIANTILIEDIISSTAKAFKFITRIPSELNFNLIEEITSPTRRDLSIVDTTSNNTDRTMIKRFKLSPEEKEKVAKFLLTNPPLKLVNLNKTFTSELQEKIDLILGSDKSKESREISENPLPFLINFKESHSEEYINILDSLHKNITEQFEAILNNNAYDSIRSYQKFIKDLSMVTLEYSQKKYEEVDLANFWDKAKEVNDVIANENKKEKTLEKLLQFHLETISTIDRCPFKLVNTIALNNYAYFLKDIIERKEKLFDIRGKDSSYFLGLYTETENNELKEFESDLVNFLKDSKKTEGEITTIPSNLLNAQRLKRIKEAIHETTSKAEIPLKTLFLGLCIKNWGIDCLEEKTEEQDTDKVKLEIKVKVGIEIEGGKKFEEKILTEDITPRDLLENTDEELYRKIIDNNKTIVGDQYKLFSTRISASYTGQQNEVRKISMRLKSSMSLRDKLFEALLKKCDGKSIAEIEDVSGISIAYDETHEGKTVELSSIVQELNDFELTDTIIDKICSYSDSFEELFNKNSFARKDKEINVYHSEYRTIVEEILGEGKKWFGAKLYSILLRNAQELQIRTMSDEEIEHGNKASEGPNIFPNPEYNYSPEEQSEMFGHDTTLHTDYRINVFTINKDKFIEQFGEEAFNLFNDLFKYLTSRDEEFEFSPKELA